MVQPVGMVDSLIPVCQENALKRFPFTFTAVELGVDFTELELNQLPVENLVRLYRARGIKMMTLD